MPISIRLRHSSKISLRMLASLESLKPQVDAASESRVAPSRGVSGHCRRIAPAKPPRSPHATAKLCAATFDEMVESAATSRFTIAPSTIPNCSTRYRRPHGAPARRAECARAHLRPARSAPAAGRSRRARRPGRRHLAAGDAQRSLAQPADAARARPRSAGAADRPCRRTTSRRRSARPRSILTRAAKVAGAPTVASRFRAAARRGCGRNALGRGAAGAANNISIGRRALDRPATREAVQTAGAEAAARGAAETLYGHRDRALAARSRTRSTPSTS